MTLPNDMWLKNYLVFAGLEDRIKIIMNSYMSELLSTSEFYTNSYNVSTEFTYLFNAVAFDYHLMNGKWWLGYIFPSKW